MTVTEAIKKRRDKTKSLKGARPKWTPEARYSASVRTQSKCAVTSRYPLQRCKPATFSQNSADKRADAILMCCLRAAI
jgi:hypothetical protein